MKSTIRVAALQTSAKGLELDQNLKLAEKIIDKAGQNKVDLAVTVELFNREFFPALGMRADYLNFAEELRGPTVRFLSRAAKRNKINLVGSLYEKSNVSGLNYDTLLLIDSSGSLVYKYRKSHIPIIPEGAKNSSANYEKYYFSPGNTGFKSTHLTIRNQEVKLGMLVCYDRNFPEAWRSLALDGAEIVFLSSSSTSAQRSDKPELHEKQIASHAYENGFFVVSANRSGIEGHANYYGRSCIADPWGRIIASASPETGPQIVMADIDLADLQRARARSSHFRDRRPELYTSLVNQDYQKSGDATSI